MIVTSLERKRIQWSIGCVLIVGFILAALNWPQERVRVRFWHVKAISSTPSEFLSDGQSELESLGQHAGWPVSVPLTNPAELPMGDLASALAANLFVAGMICLIAGAVVIAIPAIRTAMLSQFGSNRKEHPAEAAAGRCLLGCAGGAIGIAILCLVAMTIVVGQRVGTEQRLATELRDYGAVGRSTELPAFFAHRMPLRFLAPLAQIDNVSVRSVPPDLLEQVQSKASLRVLKLIDHTIDRELWSKLATSRTLESLSLTNCTLRADVTDSLRVGSRGHLTLQRLVIDRCRGTGSLFDSLPLFSNLRSLVYVDSPLPHASSIGEDFPPELRELQLSIDAGVVKQLRLAGLAQLQTFRLHTSPKSPVQEIVSVELENLDQLTAVTIPSDLQLNLSATDVPRLQMITAGPDRHNWFPEDEATSPLQIRNLTIDQAPSLQGLQLGRESLQRFSISRTPNLRTLAIMPAQSKSLRRWVGSWNSEDQGIISESVNDWILSVAKCDGPTSLDLSGVSLAGLDLSPLAQNRRLKELILAGTGVRADQLMAIEPNNRIKSLDLQGCEIGQDDLQALFSAYRGVERLLVDTNHFETLEIIDQPQLTHLFCTTTRSAREVKIVGCPQLTGNLTLGHGLDHLEIRDAQSLNGLSTSGWLPKDAVLEGFRDLEIVEIGGENIREAHFEALLNCKALSELTLATPSIPAAAFKEINRFSELLVLKLPGAKMTDEVVAQWHSLRHLREIDLSHTQVTGRALQSLSQYANLQRLNLDHSQVRKDDLGTICEMKTLLEIDLAGIGITAADLQLCLDSVFIDRINLSGTTIDSEIVDVLTSEDARRLVFIGLNDCRLSDEDVLRIANAHPRLAMDIGGNGLSSSVVRNLAGQGRLVASHDRLGFEAWLHRLASDQFDRVRSKPTKSARSQASDFFKSLLAVAPRSNRSAHPGRNQSRLPVWVRRNFEPRHQN